MPVYKGKMDNFFYDSKADAGDDCEVRIDNGEIVVSFDRDDGPVLYRGMDRGHGHYILASAEEEARATLHGLLGSVFLEGYWEIVDKRECGMWRIRLITGGNDG